MERGGNTCVCVGGGFVCFPNATRPLLVPALRMRQTKPLSPTWSPFDPSRHQFPLSPASKSRLRRMDIVVRAVPSAPIGVKLRGREETKYTISLSDTRPHPQEKKQGCQFQRFEALRKRKRETLQGWELLNQKEKVIFDYYLRGTLRAST